MEFGSVLIKRDVTEHASSRRGLIAHARYDTGFRSPSSPFIPRFLLSDFQLFCQTLVLCRALHDCFPLYVVVFIPNNDQDATQNLKLYTQCPLSVLESVCQHWSSEWHDLKGDRCIRRYS